VEVDDGVLVLRRIKVRYQLRAPQENHEIATRTHAFHKKFCPVYRSIEGSIDVTTEISFITEP
jgi:organic hydroperoxide reductase OsmC/OhrA